MITKEDGYNGDYQGLRLEQLPLYLGREERQGVLVYYATVEGGQTTRSVAQLSPAQARVLADLRHDPEGRYLSSMEKQHSSNIPAELLTTIPHDEQLFAALTSAALTARYDVVRDRI